MRVNLRTDWLGPDATLYRAKHNPNVMPDEWAEGEPEKRVLPSTADILENDGSVRQRYDKDGKPLGTSAAKGTHPTTLPKDTEKTGLVPTQVNPTTGKAESDEDRAKREAATTQFNAAGESLTGTSGNQSGTNQPNDRGPDESATHQTRPQGDEDEDDNKPAKTPAVGANKQSVTPPRK